MAIFNSYVSHYQRVSMENHHLFSGKSSLGHRLGRCSQKLRTAQGATRKARSNLAGFHSELQTNWLMR